MRQPTRGDYPPGFSLLPDGGDAALNMRAATIVNAIAVFSLRRGGCSPPPFDSLNFSINEGDTPENVRANLSLLSGHLLLDPARIAFARQVHGSAIEVLESVPRIAPTADALATAVPGLFLAVKTADCLPILLLDPARRVVAAVHAGWNGTRRRIVRNVVRMMKSEFRSDPSDLLVFLGPAIGSCCYEVGETVLVPFRREFPGADSFIVSLGQRENADPFQRHNPADPIAESSEFLRARGLEPRPLTATREASKSFRLNLVGANRAELRREGIPENHIFATNLCTACYPDLFFSHRRDHGRTGRHIAIVGFRP
ncbi:MAG: peptidoglycan editing factor PgeF [Deltaproteobacteria bacterium]